MTGIILCNDILEMIGDKYKLIKETEKNKKNYQKVLKQIEEAKAFMDNWLVRRRTDHLDPGKLYYEGARWVRESYLILFANGCDWSFPYDWQYDRHYETEDEDEDRLFNAWFEYQNRFWYEMGIDRVDIFV